MKKAFVEKVVASVFVSFLMALLAASPCRAGAGTQVSGWYGQMYVNGLNLDTSNNITVFVFGGTRPSGALLTDCGSKFAFNATTMGSNFQPAMQLFMAAFLTGRPVDIYVPVSGPCAGAFGAFGGANSSISP